MLTELFDFTLPDDLIALRPAEPRDSARLLVVQENGEIAHHCFGDLPILLKENDVLSFNDSKVIAARLSATRTARLRGGQAIAIEVTLHQRAGACCYKAFAQPARRLKDGDVLDFRGGLQAKVLERAGGRSITGF